MSFGSLGSFTAQGVTAGVALPVDPIAGRLAAGAERAVFQLGITATSGVGTDTLDVYLQHSHDGVNWDDFGHFAQRTVTQGATGATPPQLRWFAEMQPEAESVAAIASGALAAGSVVQGPIGPFWRAFVKVAGTTGTFTGFVTVTTADE